MANPQAHVAVIDTGPSLRFDPSASPILYLGLAAAGSGDGKSVWQITRFDTTSGVTALHPDGNDSYIFAWTLRASYAYS